MPRILIGVLSAQGYQSRRAACRATWMGDLRGCPGASAVFLHGAGNRAAGPVLVDDLLLLPCPDEYASLPQRTRWFCRWALTRDDWDYLFKCDDDTYVCTHRLVACDLNGKDYVGAEWMPGVGYASGGAGYFLSRRAAAIVAEGLTAATGAEDELVGQLLREAGVLFFRDDRFVAYGNDRPRPRPDNDLITTHAVGVDTFHQIHREFTFRWRFRIVMPTSNAFAAHVVPATLALLDEFWPQHPPVDLLHYDCRPAEQEGVSRFYLGSQDEVTWTDGLARYLTRYHDDDLLLLMLDDYGLSAPPNLAAIIAAQRAMLADPQIANVHLTWQPAQPKSPHGDLLLLPQWAYSVNTQAALWRRDLLLAALIAHPHVGSDQFELSGSQWFNQTQFERYAHCQVAMPEPPQPSGYVDETDKRLWALPYHNLMHRGRPCERHRQFLADRGLAVDA
jgi:hypothetical protein